MLTLFQRSNTRNGNGNGNGNGHSTAAAANKSTCTTKNSGYVLVEIVSALNAPNMDLRGKDADPYVTVHLLRHEHEHEHEQEVHRTGVLYNTRYPIWDFQNRSLFLLPIPAIPDPTSTTTTTTTSASATATASVVFHLKEFDALRTDAILGTLQVPMETLLDGTGCRTEHVMDVPKRVLEITRKKRKIAVRQTRLVLRYKPATAQDIEFVQTLHTHDHKKAGIFAQETYLPPTPSANTYTNNIMPITPLPQITEWIADTTNTITGQNLFNPTSKDDYLLMEAMKPSREWIDVGQDNNSADSPTTSTTSTSTSTSTTGQDPGQDPGHGKVYLEILACDDLPNMDLPTITNFNNKTDAFCCIILEDSIVNTSYIPNSLNPRWTPTGDNRAFVFHNVKHPSSDLFIGVFDHDPVYPAFIRNANVFRKRVHDPIGRVLVNLTHLHSHTLYTLRYNIFEVSQTYAADTVSRQQGKHNGTILIRIMIQWENRVLAGIGLPPSPFLIAVPNKRDYQNAMYTTVGERDPGTFSLRALSSHVDELQGYVSQEHIDMLISAGLTVLLWRSHYEVTRFHGRKIKLPLQSMVAFTWAILVTQNYNRFPSFVLFAIAWVFLASMEQNRRHPSPWHKCKSYPDLLRALVSELLEKIVGFEASWVRKKQRIPPNANLEAILAHNDAIQKRKIAAAEEQFKREAQLEEEIKQHLDEMQVLEEDLVAAAAQKTAAYFSSVNIIKPILHPVQITLYQACLYARIAKSIVMWEENYFAFWIVTFLLTASVLIMFVPFGLVLRWVIRIVVLSLTGPWMRILDWYYFFDQAQDMTAELKDKILQEQIKKQHQEFQKQRLLSRQRREEVVKLRSIMKYYFGKYLVRVPQLREVQISDFPLPSSFAEPFDGEMAVQTVGQVCGQTLKNDIIPSRMIRTQPFLREVYYERPSERLTERFVVPGQSASASNGPTTTTEKKRRRFSFRKKFKKK